MPQFYFPVRKQGQFIPIEDGVMLRDLETARQEALKSCLDPVRNRLHGNHRVDELRIEIADGPVSRREDRAISGWRPWHS